jgi:hypothetical protein
MPTVHLTQMMLYINYHNYLNYIVLEQPIAIKTTLTGWQSKTTFPIALDEELIGVYSIMDKEALLIKVSRNIILKPSFIGGFREHKSGLP